MQAGLVRVWWNRVQPHAPPHRFLSLSTCQLDGPIPEELFECCHQIREVGCAQCSGSYGSSFHFERILRCPCIVRHVGWMCMRSVPS